MATQLQLRRDTYADLQLSTPVEAEPGYDQTGGRLIVGNGSRAGGIPHVSFFDNINNHFVAIDAGGTADALTLTLPESPGLYVSYQRFLFKPSANNTGAATIDINNIGAASIKKYDAGIAVDLGANDLVAGKPVEVIYDGTDFILTTLEVSTKAPTIQVFTSSSTWYKPTGLKGIEVAVTAAGSQHSSRSASFGAHCSANPHGVGGDINTSSGATTSLPLYTNIGGAKTAYIAGQPGLYGAGARGSGSRHSAQVPPGGYGTQVGSHANGGSAIKIIEAANLGHAEAVTVNGNGAVVVREYY